VVAIYKRQMRDWARQHGNLDHFQFQPVLPVVLYTGTRTWDKLRRFAELVELGDELADVIPDFQPLFLNVGQTSREALEQRGGPFGRLLRLVQQRRTQLPVFAQTLREVVPALEGLADEDRERWLDLLSYLDAFLYHERDTNEYEPLQQTVAAAVQHDRHRQEVYDMARTMAEHLQELGRQEGLQKGEVHARQEYLLRLLRNKFGKLPAAVVRRIESTEQIDLLDSLFDQAWAAKKLTDLSFPTE
jgi:hypothetical protein